MTIVELNRKEKDFSFFLTRTSPMKIYGLFKNPPANVKDMSTPGSDRSPGVGNGNSLQYSYLENSMDKGAWWATVHGVTKSQTRVSTHTYDTVRK